MLDTDISPNMPHPIPNSSRECLFRDLRQSYLYAEWVVKCAFPLSINKDAVLLWLVSIVVMAKFASRKSLINGLNSLTNHLLTQLSRVTHICVSKLTIIGSDSGLSPCRRQAIIWTNDGILLIGPIGTNFGEILIEIITFSFMKMRLKVSSAKRRPFCLSFSVNRKTWLHIAYIYCHFIRVIHQFASHPFSHIEWHPLSLGPIFPWRPTLEASHVSLVADTGSVLKRPVIIRFGSHDPRRSQTRGSGVNGHRSHEMCCVEYACWLRGRYHDTEYLVWIRNWLYMARSYWRAELRRHLSNINVIFNS